MKLPKAVGQMTVDAAHTLGGVLVAGAVGASAAYLQGTVTKEGMIAAAIIAIGGYYAKRGDKTKLSDDGVQ